MIDKYYWARLRVDPTDETDVPGPSHDMQPIWLCAGGGVQFIGSEVMYGASQVEIGDEIVVPDSAYLQGHAPVVTKSAHG